MSKNVSKNVSKKVSGRCHTGVKEVSGRFQKGVTGKKVSSTHRGQLEVGEYVVEVVEL